MNPWMTRRTAPGPSRTSRLPRLVVAAACCALLAACSSQESGYGGKDGRDQGVDSVKTPKGEGGAGKTSGGSGGSGAGGTGNGKGGKKGVMIPMTASNDEMAAIDGAWMDCLESHGVQMVKKPRTGQKLIKNDESREPAAAYRACADKEPYPDPLLDKDTNPHYAEQTKALMACLNSHGIEVSGDWDDEFWTWGKVAPKLAHDDEARHKVRDKCYVESYKW